MASSNRRKKQDRAKAAAKHAEARRLRAATARIRAMQARFSRIHDPETPVAELAVLLAQHYQGVRVAGWLASALLEEGSSLARLQDAARLMLADQDAPSLTALTFAAAVARAAGNAEEERLIDQALAAEESADRERAAVHRFADRTSLIALRDAVSAFLDGTELGEAVQARVVEELTVTNDLDWSPEDRVAFGKLAEELALLTADPGHDEDETSDAVEDSLADDDPLGTPLRAFAAFPANRTGPAAWNGWPRNLSAISASGVVCRAYASSGSAAYPHASCNQPVRHGQSLKTNHQQRRFIARPRCLGPPSL
jgi:hypothetical protein